MKIQKTILILSVFITSCSSKTIGQTETINNVPVVTNEIKFEIILNTYIDNSDSSEKEVYKQLFGMEKSKKEAKNYCEKLDKGSNMFREYTNKYDEFKKKVEDNIITKDEFDKITSIYHAIFYTAQDTYCPQHRSLEQIPLNERMK